MIKLQSEVDGEELEGMQVMTPEELTSDPLYGEFIEVLQNWIVELDKVQKVRSCSIGLDGRCACCD